MRRNLFAVLVAAVVVGVSAPSWAVEHTFFLDALDINNPVGGVENAVFVVTVRNQFDEVMFQEQMENYGGALYFIVDDGDLGPNWNWEVRFEEAPGWRLLIPADPIQNFGPIGPGTSHNAGQWWFEAEP